MRKKAFVCFDIGYGSMKAVVSLFNGSLVEQFTLKYQHVYPNISDRANALSAEIEQRLVTIEHKHSVRVESFSVILPLIYASSDTKDFFMYLSSAYAPVFLTELHTARLSALPMQGHFSWEYHLIDYYRRACFVDDQQVSEFPLKAKVNRIGLTAQMLFMTKQLYCAFELVSQWWGIELSRVIPYSMAVEAYIKRERTYSASDSAVVVDIGKKSTSLLWFSNGICVRWQQLFIGGEDIDWGLAAAFCLARPLAEEIKIQYGSLVDTTEHQNKNITVKTEDGYRTIPARVFMRTVRDLYDTVIRQISGAIQGALPDKIYCVGGGVLIEGFEQLLSTKLYGSRASVIVLRNLCHAAQGGASYVSRKKHIQTKNVSPVFRFKEMMREYFSA